MDTASRKANPTAMNYRRMRSGYRCQRNRGKNHYQIAMESLAKVLEPSNLSSAVMKLALRGHGLERATLLRSRGSTVDSHEIFTGQFFLELSDEEVWSGYRRTFAHKIQPLTEGADRICRHEFNLLGAKFSYGGRPIDWHVDPVSGYRWPKKLYSEIKGVARTPPGTDIKIPWELSRMQHLPTLGKAYRLTQDERYAREIVEQITHWLDDNPCPYGVNWTCAMDVAIRIMNVVWGYLLIKDSAVVTSEFNSRIARAIFQHGQYILFNLEYGLCADGSIANGNHYLSNVVGLLHLGLICPEIEGAEAWKAIGINGLIEEMDRQVLPDGANYESSTSYHRLVLELFTAGALLCRVSGVTLPDGFWHRLERMYEFVLFAIRPDGTMPLVGDTDDSRLYILSDYGTWNPTDCRYLLSLGAALFRRGDMKARARGFAEDAFWWLGPSAVRTYHDLPRGAAALKSKAFPDAGLYVMRHGENYLLASCGRGVEGAAAHKHNDLLSFELYAGDKAFIVDPGTYVYTREPKWRNLFRSTAYHNTVVIDGQEQNRFDQRRLFEMMPDARIIIHEWLVTADTDRLDAEHTAYDRLDPPVSHRRIFEFDKERSRWEIVDVLSGRGEHSADWYFHFDEGIRIEPVGEKRFQTRCEGINLEIMFSSDTPLELEVMEGWVSHRYGHKVPAQTLHMKTTFAGVCRTVVTLNTLKEPERT